MENKGNNELFTDMTDQFAPDDIASNKGIAAVACIPALFWLPLVTNSKDSPFAKFYANQGLILLILGVALGIVNGIVGAALSHAGIFGSIIGGLVSLVCGLAPFAGFLYVIIAAVNGKAKPLPLIGTLITAFK